MSSPMGAAALNCSELRVHSVIFKSGDEGLLYSAYSLQLCLGKSLFPCGLPVLPYDFNLKFYFFPASCVMHPDCYKYVPISLSF